MKKDIAVEIAAPIAPKIGIRIAFNTQFAIAEITVETAKILVSLTAVKMLPRNPPNELNTIDISNTDE